MKMGIKSYLKTLLNSCLVSAALVSFTTNPLLNSFWDNVVDPFLIGKTRTNPVPVRVIATAYTSDPGQTDDTPYHGATGERLFDGVVAANFLEFGTEIVIPEFFDDKIFIVKDRMNRRYTRELKREHRVDIYMGDDEGLAKKFGKRKTYIIVLN